MANENENTKQEGAENQEEPKHHDSIIERIEESIHKLDTEFPLSGAETEEDLEHAIHGEEGAEDEDQPKHHNSIIERIEDSIHELDTEFPLSGGETDEDLEGVDDKEEGE